MTRLDGPTTPRYTGEIEQALAGPRMNRDNATWIAGLRGGSADSDRTLSALREELLLGLRRTLYGRAGADDSFLEDTVQEALLRILDRLDQFAGRSRFTTWATSIAVRVALSELRRRRWRDVSFDDFLHDAVVDPNGTNSRIGDPALATERRDILQTLHAAISNDLTEKQRIALLAEMRGLPQEKIAAHLGSNRNAIYKLTHDARKRLKRSLQSAGYQKEDIQTAFAT